jgi:hypothetical protein
MYAVSPNFLLSSRIIIHNQCLNAKLVLSAYFGNGVVYSELSGQQVDIGPATKASFEIKATQDDFEGALLFKLQRYSNNQYNMGTSVIGINNVETKCVQMLVVWRSKDSKLLLRVIFVEHVKEFIWSENELRELYYKNYSRLKEYDDTILDIWFMDDNMTLKASSKVRDTKKALR